MTLPIEDTLIGVEETVRALLVKAAEAAQQVIVRTFKGPVK
jgi:hypothetical protein